MSRVIETALLDSCRSGTRLGRKHRIIGDAFGSNGRSINALERSRRCHSMFVDVCRGISGGRQIRDISNDFAETDRLKCRALGSMHANCGSNPSDRPGRMLQIS
jgi:hypothetical protein